MYGPEAANRDVETRRGACVVGTGEKMTTLHDTTLLSIILQGAADMDKYLEV